ncbi:glycoside hydrolase superfamily [Mycena floridula]|nr:glycoside hydrolase superfamily [Mycena floridula]
MHFMKIFHHLLQFSPTKRTQQAQLLTPDCLQVVYDSPTVTDQQFLPFDEAQSNIFKYRQQKSVNLGSWFVHEKWMSPSVYTCSAGQQASEIDIASGKYARDILEQHWDTWIVKSDMEYLVSIGINTIRLPIGYWSLSLGSDFLQDTPFEQVADVYVNSFSRVIRAVNWAADCGLGVIIDLHGGVGSQNGEQHSGISDHKVQLFNNKLYIRKTIQALQFLAQTFCSVTNIVGIEILNEPRDVPSLYDFYDKAIQAMREKCIDVIPYIHDGFNLDRANHYISKRKDFVVLDHHSYFLFTDQDKKKSVSTHTKDIQNDISKSLHDVTVPMIVGEWSCGLAPTSLNESAANASSKRKAFGTTQMKVYDENSAGWAFWAYKREDCDPGWCFETIVKNPKAWCMPFTFFPYDNSASSMKREEFSELSSTPAPADYNDGVRIARYFACHDRSQLGFLEYLDIYTRSKISQGVVKSNKAQDYKKGLLKGLRDEEKRLKKGWDLSC